MHLLVGLNGAGKTTYARQLEARLPAVRCTLDEWMIRLYQFRYDEPEYASLASLCRELSWDLALQVLAAGTDVVLDWNSGSRSQRLLWSSRAAEHGLPDRAARPARAG